MSSTTAINQKQEMPLGKAALLAGFSILIMALTVPLVEFYIFPTLINHKNPAQTTQNIINNTALFSTAIFIHFVTVICDIVAAWALYIFLKPANKNLAILAFCFRLVYTAFNVAALLNLIQLLAIIKPSESVGLTEAAGLNNYVLIHLNAFNMQWRFGLVFFGIYLCFLGYLVLQAKYVPRFIAVCLLVAGLGYLIDDLKYFFYSNLNTGFLWFTFFGELIFMFWLLFKGSRIQETNK